MRDQERYQRPSNGYVNGGLSGGGSQNGWHQYNGAGPPRSGTSGSGGDNLLRHRNNYQRRQPTRSIASIVGEFKETPRARARFTHRPFMGRCCTCIPNSRSDFYKSEMENKGLQNILARDHTNSPGVFFDLWNWISHGWRQKLSFAYPNVLPEVMKSPILVDAIQRTVLEEQELDDLEELDDSQWAKLSLECKSKAKNLLSSMQAYLSNGLVRFVAWSLHKVFRWLIASIVVHRGQMEILCNACKNHDVPVIFLPNHSSHLDYILVTFILQNYDIMPPHVAAGENLNLPILGKQLRGLGGYFIRRRIDKQKGRRDYIYRALLQTYMQELLRRNQYFEFFVEGGRSRSGKPLYPKGGLMSAIVQAYVDGTIEDAYIVPVSFSYDRIMDGNFLSEQQGHAKKPETFCRMVWSLCRILRGYYGHIRVNFTQPFSLKEYMRVSQTFDYTPLQLSQFPLAARRDSVVSLPTPTTSQLPAGVGALAAAVSSEAPSSTNRPGRVIMPSTSSNSNCSLMGSEASDEMRCTIHGLALHVVHSFVNSQALMSTHITAFLLLNEFRQGVSLQSFVQRFSSMLCEVSTRNRDVGFSGDAWTVVLCSLQILGPKLVNQRTMNNNATGNDGDQNNNSNSRVDTWLQPAVTMPHVIELSYYAASVSCLFALDSIIALSLNTLINEDSWFMRGHQTKVTVSRSRLVEQATDLCVLLPQEFTLKPPCSSYDSVISSALDNFIAADLLITEEEDYSSYGHHSSYMRKKAYYWDRNSESEDDTVDEIIYLATLERKETMDRLKLLQSVVAPYLEAYYIIACKLVDLKDNKYTEREFVTYAHTCLKNRIKQNMLNYPECACLDTVRNAVTSYIQLGLVEYKRDQDKLDAVLALPNDDVQRVNRFAAHIQAYQPHIHLQ